MKEKNLSVEIEIKLEEIKNDLYGSWQRTISVKNLGSGEGVKTTKR